MRSRHSMPFGADLRADGVRFALWSPSASRRALVLEGEKPREMTIGRNGWAELFVAGIKAGARYSFCVNDGLTIPDPASRFQPEGPLAASRVVDPAAFLWNDADWRGRPWEEAVVWEAHVGAATPGGTYAALAEKLPELADFGATAIELMPVSDCPGGRNWGYDGVLPFAPNHAYGSPDDLKRLIARAHELGLTMLLDVVYNHFGPSGNFLRDYAASFFNESHATPWGAAINFDGADNRPVRDFFIHNALYWLEEFHFDGLRFDAVHAIVDDSGEPFLAELAERVRNHFPERRIHLVLENEKNQARWLTRDQGRPRFFSAQWNDDSHHCWHRLLTGESEAYYEDFDHPAHRLGRALAEGFVYQGEPSRHQDGKPRGEKSAALPPCAFVSFLQNHDQVGNRAFGERLTKLADPGRLALAHAGLLLSPQIPMLFMGEEWDASSPFLFFVDFAHDQALSKAVRDGRRQEFSRFAAFSAPERIPDPTAAATFAGSKLDWSERRREPHLSKLRQIRELLKLRRLHVIPLLVSGFDSASYAVSEADTIDVEWRFEAGTLRFVANLGENLACVSRASNETIFWRSPTTTIAADSLELPSWTGAFAVSARHV
jgi:maltooligosyltrehalose trehalohydrolase